MLYSMTGFGQAQAHTELGTLSVEIKTLNSKQCDINYLRLPDELKICEAEVRTQLMQALQRGKVECVVTLTTSEEDTPTDRQYIHLPLLRYYIQELQKAASAFYTPYPPSDLESFLLKEALRMPNVWREPIHVLNAHTRTLFFTTLQEAIAQCKDFRKTEGEATQHDLENSLSAIEALRVDVEGMQKERVDSMRTRLQEGVKQLEESTGVTMDKARFAQEILFYVERLDINEELKRLAQHNAYFHETLCGEPGQGKKLGFIAQEIGREINTIGSKANHTEIQRKVVEMKDHLEKIKEQVQNVL